MNCACHRNRNNVIFLHVRVNLSIIYLLPNNISISPQGLEIDNCHLRNSLTNEKTRSLDLEKELIRKKMRLFDLENELKELKSECTCRKASADLFPHSVDDASFKFSQCQMAELQEVPVMLLLKI